MTRQSVKHDRPRRIARQLFSLLIVWLAFAQAISAADRTDVRLAIETANKRLMAAIERSDSAAIAKLYTRTAEILPPYHEIVAGRAEIRKFWDGTIASGLHHLRLSTLEVAAYGEIAYEVGEYSVPGDKGDTLARGKYLVVWMRENGRWKLHRDTIAPTTLLR